MADNYCPVCRKVTPHKSLMRRCPTQSSTKWQEMITRLFKGTHYYDMECQHYCRVCNQHNESASHSLAHHTAHVSSITLSR